MTIEGIPDGWELVAFRRAVSGDYFLNTRGLPEPWTLNVSSGSVFTIIRKIEKPKQYRPFKNAAEFRPHKERWILRAYKDWVDGDGEYRISGFDDDGVWSNQTEFCSYQQMLDDDRRFDDGTPFGIEVTE